LLIAAIGFARNVIGFGFGFYGFTRLASCIHEIRKAGYEVATDVRRDAQGHKYAKYS
jgi:hypothetical protein